MIRDFSIFTLPPGEATTQLPLPLGEGWGEGELGKACLRGAKRGRQVHQLFGDKLNTIIEELNEALAA